MSGAMGGSRSEEFLATAENGEDTFVRCTRCDYAANVEAVRVPVPDAVPYDAAPAAHVEDTPDTPTIETLVDRLNEAFPREDRPWTAGDTLKNVIVMIVHPDGTREPLAIGLPGDRDVDLKRLEAQVAPRRGRGVRRGGLRRAPRAGQGLHRPPVRSARRATAKVRYLLDPRVVEGTRWVTGADEPGRHVIDLVAGRDFTADGTIEAAEVRAGDVCPSCGEGVLETARGIEMGHIFQLGRKFADALGLKVLDQNGKQVTVTMGSYGVGVSRAVAAVAEGNHDEVGLVWPRELSPADVHVVATGKDEDVFAAADEVTAELERRGVTRAVRRPPQGLPGREVQGRRAGRGADHRGRSGATWPRATIEVRDRRSGAKRDVPVAEAVDAVVGRGPRQAARPDGRRGSRGRQAGGPLRAVIFDWGGTLTPWHTVDLAEQWSVFAAAVHDGRGAGGRAGGPHPRR